MISWFIPCCLEGWKINTSFFSSKMHHVSKTVLWLLVLARIFQSGVIFRLAKSVFMILRETSQVQCQCPVSWTYLVVRWQRLGAPNAGGPYSIPGQETRSCMPNFKKRLGKSSSLPCYPHCSHGIPVKQKSNCALSLLQTYNCLGWNPVSLASLSRLLRRGR